MSFASKLQEIRVENNISQEGLAEMLGVSRQSVSKWERGKGYPEIDKLIFISERFGVSLDELLKEKKDASGNPRRTIKLTKDTKESDSVKIEYPVNSAPEEAYPERKPYAEEVNNNFFNGAVVSDRAGIAQYTNYSYTASENTGNSRSERRRNRFSKLRMRLRKRRLVILVAGFLMAFIGFTAGIINQFINQYHAAVSNGERSPMIVEYDESFSEETFDLRYMIDEATGTRYVFERQSWGIVTDLNFVNLSECTKLKEISTGEYYYCHQDYMTDCVTILDDRNICFVIPRFLTLTSLDVESQKEYTAYQDVNSQEWYFVPDWIIRNADEGLDDADQVKKSDDNSEDNAVPDDAAPEAENEILDDNA